MRPRYGLVPRHLAVAACSIVLAALPRSAGAAGVWAPVGPEGGAVTALVVDPADPQVVYAGTADAGVFKSRDGAGSWSLLPASPSGFREGIGDLVLGPGGTLYARHGSGVWRSDDGGATWVDASPPDPVFAFAADPARPGLVYAGSFQVFRSHDAGATWQRLTSFPVPPGPQRNGIRELQVDAGGTLWAATTDQGVQRSRDGGGSWQAANGGLTGLTLRVRALGVAPGVPDRLYASVSSGGIYETLDGGESWTLRGPDPGVDRLVVDPADPDRLWALPFGRPLLVSGDRGASWTEVGAGPAAASAVALGPAGTGAVYAGDRDGSYRSHDGGATWQTSVEGLFARPILDLDGRPEAGDRLLAIPYASLTVLRSPDAGATWSPGLSLVTEVASSGADPELVYAVGALGDAALRSTDGGLTWEIAAEFEEIRLFDVWPDPRDPDVVYVAGQARSGEVLTSLLRSSDRGVSWDEVWYGDDFITDLGFGAGRPRTLLVGLTSGKLVRSVDEGVSWRVVDAAGIEPQGRLFEFAADPAVPGRFLGSVSSPPPPARPSSAGLVETTDHGDSWHRYGAGLPRGFRVRLLFDPASPSTVYASTFGLGIYRSLDGGATWSPIGSGAPSDRPEGNLELALAGDPIRLFAGSVRSVLAADPEAVAPCVDAETTLCLQGGRFEVRVSWEDFQGSAGDGHAVPLTGNTGAFWFFRESNLELAVKLVDGRGVNGFWWVFYGSLSNVPFTLTVTDTATGSPRTYQNPPRTFASRGDTAAF